MIFYVDDKPEDLLDTLKPDQVAQIEKYNPKDSVNDPAERQKTWQAAVSSAEKADLWLFDYFLGEHDTAALTSDEDNGLSAFQRFRRLAKDSRPVTALISSDPTAAVGEEFPPGRMHIAAERAGVEWVGNKTQFSCVKSLHEASTLVREIAEKTPDGQAITTETICFAILSAPTDQDWSSTAERQVDRARPPQLSTFSNSKAQAREVVAWLLHRVLPYQSFLLSKRQVALRLGISLTAVDAVIADENSDIAAQLTKSAYGGPLASLDGARWCRAGIDNIAWKASQSEKGYQNALQGMAGKAELEFLVQRDPVLVSNSDLVETDEFADASECVRAQDEHFPADVAPAWVRRSDLENDKNLAAKVIFEDRDLIAEGETQ